MTDRINLDDLERLHREATTNGVTYNRRSAIAFDALNALPHLLAVARAAEAWASEPYYPQEQENFHSQMMRHSARAKALREAIAPFRKPQQETAMSESRSTDTVLAWHWLPAMGRLTNDDKRKVIPGRTLKHKGDLVICDLGFHASVRAIDALQYAPGPIIQRVECSDIGDPGTHTDKLVCRERKCLWQADATDTLRALARWCAMSVIDKWGAPPVVRQYLETGDESIRAAARAAAMGRREGRRDGRCDGRRDGPPRGPPRGTPRWTLRGPPRGPRKTSNLRRCFSPSPRSALAMRRGRHDDERGSGYHA